jgi:hypothetical protein
VRLATARGHGVIYFYWEGLWGVHAGKEGAAQRLAAFRQLHQSVNGQGTSGRAGTAAIPPPPPLPALPQGQGRRR